MSFSGLDLIRINLAKDSDVDVLTHAVEWQAAFGVPGVACAKRVYSQRQRTQKAQRVMCYYPQAHIISRDQFTNPEGMRSVRISNFDCEEFAVRLDCSFREPAGVIAVRFPQNYYKTSEE